MWKMFGLIISQHRKLSLLSYVKRRIPVYLRLCTHVLLFFQDPQFYLGETTAGSSVGSKRQGHQRHGKERWEGEKDNASHPYHPFKSKKYGSHLPHSAVQLSHVNIPSPSALNLNTFRSAVRSGPFEKGVPGVPSAKVPSNMSWKEEPHGHDLNSSRHGVEGLQTRVKGSRLSQSSSHAGVSGTPHISNVSAREDHDQAALGGVMVGIEVPSKNRSNGYGCNNESLGCGKWAHYTTGENEEVEHAYQEEASKFITSL
jgi:hypothetical protein